MRGRARRAAQGAAIKMTHEEARALLHALVDNELDAGHALEVGTHAPTCPVCAPLLRDYRTMQRALSTPELADRAPPSLRARIEQALPQPQPRAKPTTLRAIRGS